MIHIKTYRHHSSTSSADMTQVASFLFEHLEGYGDPLRDIELAMDYALQVANKPGGVILTSWDDQELTGAVVINKTGMNRYIPENILVYIATHAAYRGKGIGKALMNKAIETAEGDIALHVEADNPARKLYEKLGFTNKYLEMRFKKGD